MVFVVRRSSGITQLFQIDQAALALRTPSVAGDRAVELHGAVAEAAVAIVEESLGHTLERHLNRTSPELY